MEEKVPAGVGKPLVYRSAGVLSNGAGDGQPCAKENENIRATIGRRCGPLPRAARVASPAAQRAVGGTRSRIGRSRLDARTKKFCRGRRGVNGVLGTRNERSARDREARWRERQNTAAGLEAAGKRCPQVRGLLMLP